MVKFLIVDHIKLNGTLVSFLFYAANTAVTRSVKQKDASWDHCMHNKQQVAKRKESGQAKETRDDSTVKGIVGTFDLKLSVKC